MVRLRNALMTVALATGAFGCAQWSGAQPGQQSGYAHWSIFHCSECDDFPMPAYGPNYSMMPGTYSGASPESASSSRMGTPTSSNAPATSDEAAVPPPDERPGNPTSEPPVPGNTPPLPPPASNP